MSIEAPRIIKIIHHIIN